MGEEVKEAERQQKGSSKFGVAMKEMKDGASEFSFGALPGLNPVHEGIPFWVLFKILRYLDRWVELELGIEHIVRLGHVVQYVLVFIDVG